MIQLKRLCDNLVKHDTSNEEELRARAARDKQISAETYARENANDDRVLMAMRKYVAEDNEFENGSDYDEDRAKRSTKRNRITATTDCAESSSTPSRTRGRDRDRGTSTSIPARVTEDDDAVMIASSDEEHNQTPPRTISRQTKLTVTIRRTLNAKYICSGHC